MNINHLGELAFRSWVRVRVSNNTYNTLQMIFNPLQFDRFQEFNKLAYFLANW